MVHRILDAKNRGHRAFANVKEDVVRARARRLQEDGVPEETCRCLDLDNDLDKLCIRKAATPVDGGHKKWNEESAAEFRTRRPNAVVLERTSQPRVDSVALQGTALQHLAAQIEPEAEEAQQHKKH